MNKYAFTLLGIALLSMKTDNDKTKLISQKWFQFATKQHGKDKPTVVPTAIAITYILKEDNTYQEFQYNGMLKIAGKWKFTEDEKKLLFTISKVNGKDIPSVPTFEGKPTTIILKLTTDTLIIGNEAYYGNNAIYGHDDQYFVRVK